MEFSERKIVIGMIDNDEYISRIYSSYKSEYLRSKIARKIADWCIDFYKNHHAAPHNTIDSLVAHMQQDKRHNEDDIADILSVMDSLSKESSTINVSFLLAETFDYFSAISAENLANNIKVHLESNDIASVKEAIAKYNMPEKPESVGVVPWEESVIKEAFSEDATPTFEYDGAIGDLLNCELYKESFVAFLAPAKTGKTWFLMDAALLALTQGCKVAFFQAGDMSQGQFVRRMATHLLKNNYKERYCEAHWSPVVDCVFNQNGGCMKEEHDNNIALFNGGDVGTIRKLTKEEVVAALESHPRYKACHICQTIKQKGFVGTVSYRKVKEKEPLSVEQVKSFVQQNKEIFDSANFKLCTYPTETLDCRTIRSSLEKWNKEGFVPDTIVIDYADIMKAEGKAFTKKEKSSDVFIHLRQLSQEYKVCLITATQSDAAGMEVESLTAMNFCDDVDKLKHLTALIGLNQKGEEKEKGIIRLNKILSRDEGTSLDKEVKVLQNLWIGRPVLGSYY